METVQWFLNALLHVDEHLHEVIQQYGTWTYLILFAIIFCETGLVVTPILPGDSLLFAAGVFAAKGALDLAILMFILWAAAVLGDAVNYACGHYIGPRIFKPGARVLKVEHLERTHRFYEKYGNKTIVLARFVPIVRTFAPFVAGIGKMPYGRFALYNVVGGAAWVGICTYAGYRFGSIPIVAENFSLVALGIVFVSVLPLLFEITRAQLEQRRIAAVATEPSHAEKSEQSSSPVE